MEPISYDFSFLEENIEKEYTYCGFNVKIASVTTVRGLKYYGVANTGTPPLHPPYLHDAMHRAESEIQDSLDIQDTYNYFNHK